MGRTALTIAQYIHRSSTATRSIPVGQIHKVYLALESSRDLGEPVWVVGNGGSLAAAQHLVLHLRQAKIEAVDLMADASWLSAESNDRGYHGALVRGFEHYRPPGAIVVISGSGNSMNCLDLVRAYKRPEFVAGPNIIGLLGMGGGRLKQYCDAAVVVQSNEYGPIEDAHIAIIHALSEALGAPVFGPMSEEI